MWSSWGLVDSHSRGVFRATDEQHQAALAWLNEVSETRTPFLV